jgi:reversibly glycosylated polypeptide/UDP-arabinopyranose mutase
MINHGLWNGVPDLDGKTQTAVGTITVNFSEHSIQVPPGVLFPMSSMNLAFRREALPLMWPPLMGEGQPYHRFDDIWCGWIAKKVCDHLGWAVRSGVPFVYHSRASDAERNRQLEEPGIVQNDRLWKVVHGAMIQGATPAACIADLWDQIVAEMDGDYWQKCRTAALRWVELCDRI